MLVFEAELFAIYEILKQLLMKQWLRNDSARLIDSKSAILSIRDKYKVVKSNICRVVIQWVPSYRGLKSNEVADKLAKKRHLHKTESFKTYLKWMVGLNNVKNKSHFLLAQNERRYEW